MIRGLLKAVELACRVPTFEEEAQRLQIKYGYSRKEAFRIIEEHEKLRLWFDTKHSVDEWIDALNEGFKKFQNEGKIK
jgi:hypothetical protein